MTTNVSSLFIVIVAINYIRHENRKILSCLYNEWEMKIDCIAFGDDYITMNF